MRKRRAIPLIAGGAVVVAGAVAWFNRTSIADDFIASTLDEAGVEARYKIDRIGVRHMRVSDVVLGSRANPDLVARELDIRLGVGWTGPYVTAVRARGVQVRGLWTGEKLSFGQIDRLLPEPDGTPFAFPDVALDIDDVTAQIETPWGRVGLDSAGRGNPARDFAGEIALSAPRLRVDDCRADRTTARLAVRIANGSPRVRGPAGIAALGCPEARLALSDLRIGLDGSMDEALTDVRMRAGLRGGAAELAGVSARALTGEVTVDGALDGAIDADWQLAVSNAAQTHVLARAVTINGRGKRMANGALVADGRIALTGARVAAATRRGFDGLRAFDDSTPVGPLARKLGAALDAAGNGFAVSGAYTVAGRNAGALSAVGNDFRLVADSGARVDLIGERALRWSGLAGLSVDGRVEVGGGGLPEGSISLSKPGGGAAWAGEARFAAFAAEDAIAAVAPVRFSIGGSGATRFATGLALSGPLTDGYVDRLAMPLAGTIGADGSVAIDGTCRAVSWQAIRGSGVALAPGAIRLCGEGGRPLVAASARGLSGGATLPAFALSGRAGASALSLASEGGSLSVGRQAFALRGVAARIGEGDSATRFAAATLSGRRSGSGFAGTLAGGSGKIGPTPFLLGDANGDWQWRDGTLRLETAITVDDAAVEDRFQRLRGEDVVVTYADNAVRAEGRLRESRTGTAVADVRIRHGFADASGAATFTVPAIAFAREGLQPVDLSRLALGVVASVEGRVDGSGEVRWTPDGVRSSGRFATERLDLAAAFGPVERLSGTINFDDLIALSTPPGQIARLGSVNPGIEVVDGVLRYQLLPGQQVRIEEGRWLFAGGNLLLQPALLDFSADHPRYLTFDVSDVDAAQFLQRYDFDNLSATGTFDGVLPTMFDGNGGRVLGGSLVSRDGGGTLAYVGELSNRDLGTMANIAYGALKSLRYDNLVIRLNGNIDGEMLTEVDFSGLAQGEGAERNFFTRAIARLPFTFRIRINAPFRQLLTSARGLYDPTILIDQNLPGLLRAEREAAVARYAPAVQPQESEDQP